MTGSRHIAPRRAGVVCSRTMRRSLIAAMSLLPLATHAAPAADAPAAAAADDTPPAPRSMGTVRLEGAPAGVPVFIDGEPAGITPLPGPWTLTAGAHTVELRPAGATPITRAVEVEAGREARLVLGAVTAARPAPPPADDPPPAIEAATGPGFSLATAGYVTAAVGLVSIGAGVALGLAADGAADDARAVRPPDGTRAEQQALVDDADAAAFWANVAYGAGGVLVLSGAAMALFASDGLLGDAPATVTPTAGGAAVMGAF